VGFRRPARKGEGYRLSGVNGTPTSIRRSSFGGMVASASAFAVSDGWADPVDSRSTSPGNRSVMEQPLRAAAASAALAARARRRTPKFSVDWPTGVHADIIGAIVRCGEKGSL